MSVFNSLTVQITIVTVAIIVVILIAWRYVFSLIYLQVPDDRHYRSYEGPQNFDRPQYCVSSDGLSDL